MMMAMKGSSRVWIILLLLAWTTCHPTMSASGGAEDHSGFVGAPPPPPRYPTVKFMAQGADEASYGAMLARLRQLLTSNRESSHGIAMLRTRNATGDSERYVLLEMSVGSQAGDALTLAINVVDVYIVAYHVGRTNTRHFFVEAEERDANVRRLLFPTAGTSPTVISSNYIALGTIARQGRREIPIGLPNLAPAVRDVISGGTQRNARALIILIQMVGEAARFRQIEMRIRQAPYASFVPDTFLYELENSWERLSSAVQTSVGTAFQTPVVVGGVRLDDTGSVGVIAGLILMMFICRPAPRTAVAAVQLPVLDGLQLHQVMMRRSDLEVEAAAADAKDECMVSSNPTTRIIGIHGLCVEAVSRRNEVVLNTCERGDFGNQLWTWRRDGRILSLGTGLCLTTASYKAGSYVMLRECDRLDSGSPDQWDMDPLGTLAHRNTRLVLTAYKGKSGERLVVENDLQSNYQAWTSTNKTVVGAQDDVLLIGENNQCIYYNGKRGVYTEPCSRGDRLTKMWRLYPDGTIRPRNWLNGCMELRSLDYPTSRYNYIQASNCNRNWKYTYHRWIFTREGAIQNLPSRLVVDADKKHPGYLQAAPLVPGAGNQIWSARFDY